MANKRSVDYASAGVNLQAADEALEKIKRLARSTFTKGVLSDIGSFGGLFAPPWKKYANPVLVASTDGVGTKLKVAAMAGRHDTVGQCLVNHCINDILVQGARPLFFMDYIGTGRLEPDVTAEVVSGLSQACRQNGLALLGGETAEMPGFYGAGEYDLVGTIVGIVDRRKIIDGSAIVAGDVVLGLPAIGLHTNGYSLARKICFEMAGLKIDSYVDEIGDKIGSELLKVHPSYLAPVSAVMPRISIHGMAHITGGGIAGNLIRVIPKGLKATIKTDSWPKLPIFDYLQKTGKVADKDMYDAFNMGIGLIMVVGKNTAVKAQRILAGKGQACHRIGEILKGRRMVELR